MIANEELDQRLLPLKIIWSAMLMSLFIYLFVGIYAGANLGSLMGEETFTLLKTFLYAVSLITLIAIRYIRKLFLSGKNHSGEFGQGSVNPVPGRYWIATIISLAMSESIGIYGLVLYFLGKNRIDLYLLILVSAVSFFVYRPKRDERIRLTQAGPEF